MLGVTPLCCPLVPLKDAMQIFRSARLVIVSEEPIKDPRVSCVRFAGAEGASQIIEKILSVDLIERQETDISVAATTVMPCTARWGSTA
jgi:hypothetical protein